MDKKTCTKCKQEKDTSLFHIRKDRGVFGSWCKSCNHKQVLDRQQAFKKTIVDIKGGSCVICGYNKCIAALEFHHKDPSQKDFVFSKFKGASFEKNKETILKELDKCDLLCSNCHREHHHMGA